MITFQLLAITEIQDKNTLNLGVRLTTYLHVKAFTNKKYPYLT